MVVAGGHSKPAFSLLIDLFIFFSYNYNDAFVSAL
jgi:hypothetical protein